MSHDLLLTFRLFYFSLPSYMRLCLPSCPQTWLDERLFGWSHSATRGTSAWGGGGTKSQEISRAPSPDASDDEDAGDYDNVLGFLPSSHDGFLTPGRHRSRSNQNSYADLQKLRMAKPGTSGSPYQSSQADGSPTTSPTDMDGNGNGNGDSGLHHRRERKMSLNDRVAVKRLSALDREEGFKECTDDINKEIQASKHEKGA